MTPFEKKGVIFQKDPLALPLPPPPSVRNAAIFSVFSSRIVKLVKLLLPQERSTVFQIKMADYSDYVDISEEQNGYINFNRLCLHECILLAIFDLIHFSCIQWPAEEGA